MSSESTVQAFLRELKRYVTENGLSFANREKTTQTLADLDWLYGELTEMCQKLTTSGGRRMKQFCPACGTIQTVTEETRRETYKIRNEHMTVQARFFRCAECGDTFAHAAQTDELLTAARNEYRTRRHLVGPEEIRRIRNRYAIGQKAFGLVLGLGEATVALYESGKLPTEANSNLIRLAAQPAIFRQLLTANEGKLGPTQRRKTDAALATVTTSHRRSPGFGQPWMHGRAATVGCTSPAG